ncbi:hypothetical protein JR316_0009113 [Psilocybe cubensis]|uniref:RecA family profile 1 domain-containing protein n=2 Tax=Psilocybe cubensis TaxID=181762 RepID=A0A8H7XZH7_PSICU|nr:hypothetical protein JR316_0009113 [Psilocybe cubensis]KAH9478656.1 hypothetical protein JR316_0009113 [Psilocybe cubensis]
MPPRSLLSLGLPKDILAALVRNGYETVQDLTSATLDSLSKDLNLPQSEIEALFAQRSISLSSASSSIFAASSSSSSSSSSLSLSSSAAAAVRPIPPAPTPSLPHTQSAAALLRTAHAQRTSTRCAALDALLLLGSSSCSSSSRGGQGADGGGGGEGAERGGGLPRGHILELSGPPGSPKERLAMGLVAEVVGRGEEVIFVDCQHMTTPAVLARALKDHLPAHDAQNAIQRIQYTHIHDLAQFLLFIYQLPAILAAAPKVTLLAITSISFPFQNQNAHLSPAERSAHFERVKQAFARATAAGRVSIVLTSQLSTKMVHADGTHATFDTSGARGVMLPQLAPAYLPAGKAHRVMISLDGLLSGQMKILSNPLFPHGSNATVNMKMKADMQVVVKSFVIEEGRVV